MPNCHTYLATPCFSRFGLDPETPACDYEIHFVKASDPHYVPPDSEAWPLYYRVVLETMKQYPGAIEAVSEALTEIVNQLKGRRALPPHLPHLPAFGPRKYENPHAEPKG